MTAVFDLESQKLHSSKRKENEMDIGGSSPGPGNPDDSHNSLKSNTGKDDNYGDQKIHNKPLYSPAEISDAWEKCHEFMKDRDIAMCKAWREEIKQLLIFAGLFSATVTAFIIESYKWLQPESNDVTAQYVGFLAAQFAQAQHITLPETLSRLSSPPEVTSSAIRINIFWFLSLIFNLSVVLVGILGYQWLREYQEGAPNLSHKEAVKLRQIKYQGLQSWHVPGILSSLPLLLQAALVLFFGGILDLLWHRNHAVAAVTTVAVGLILLFLVSTTIAPALHWIWCCRHFSNPFTINLSPQCPFKSTQSWLILRFTTWTRRVARRMGFSKTLSQTPPGSVHDIFSDWITFDLHWQRLGRIPRDMLSVQAIRRIYHTWSRNSHVIDLLDRCLAGLYAFQARALVRQLHQDCFAPTEAIDRGFVAFHSTGKLRAFLSIHFLSLQIEQHPILQPRWVKNVFETYSDGIGAIPDKMFLRALEYISYTPSKFEPTTMIQAINSFCVRCDKDPGSVDSLHLSLAWRILRKLNWDNEDTSLKDLDVHHFRFTCEVSKTLHIALRHKMDESSLEQCAHGITYFWPLGLGVEDMLELAHTFPEFMNIVELVMFLEANEKGGRWSPFGLGTERWHRLTSNFEKIRVNQDSLNIEEVAVVR